MKINLHGDITLCPTKTLKPPKTAKKAKVHILQQSTTTGNRHQVETKKGFIYYWTKDGKEFLHSDTDYEIKHLGGDCEHGNQKVEKRTREVKHEQEWNPWENELKKVTD